MSEQDPLISVGSPAEAKADHDAFLAACRLPKRHWPGRFVWERYAVRDDCLVLDLTETAQNWDFDDRRPTEDRVLALFRRAQQEDFRYALILIGRYRQRKGQPSCPAVVRDVIRSRDSAPYIWTTHHLRIGGGFLIEIQPSSLDRKRDEVLGQLRSVMRLLESKIADTH